MLTVDRNEEFKGKIPERILEPVEIEDKRGFFHRLLESLKVSVDTCVIQEGSGVTVKATGVHLKGGAEF